VGMHMVGPTGSHVKRGARRSEWTVCVFDSALEALQSGSWRYHLSLTCTHS
jgi:hypothetical protein